MPHYALVVDDDRPTLTLMSHILSTVQMEVVAVEDGLQALEILQSNAPDIVFLDMLLPRMSGIDLLDFIAQTPHLDATYVVVVSAQDQFGRHAALARVNSFVVKPVRTMDIRQIVLQALSEQVP